MKKTSLILLAALLAFSLGACDDKKSSAFPGYQPVLKNGAATPYLFETDTIEQLGLKRGFRFIEKKDGTYLVQPAVTDCHGHVTYKTGSTFNNDGSGHKIHDPSPAKETAAAGSDLDALLHDVCLYNRYADPLLQKPVEAAAPVADAPAPDAPEASEAEAPAAKTAAPPINAAEEDEFEREDEAARAAHKAPAGNADDSAIDAADVAAKAAATASAVAATPAAPADVPPVGTLDLNGVWDGDWDASVEKDPASFPDKSFKTWVEKLHVEISGENAHFTNSTNDVTCKLKHKDTPRGEIDLVNCRKKNGSTAKFIFTLAQRGTDLTYVLSGTQNSYIYLKKTADTAPMIFAPAKKTTTRYRR